MLIILPDETFCTFFIGKKLKIRVATYMYLGNLELLHVHMFTFITRDLGITLDQVSL